MSTNAIRLLTILFDTEISSNEIPLFRGAMLHAMQDADGDLFHNHTDDDSFRYSYPLIQYKRLGHCAAIVSIEEGADQMGKLLARLPQHIMLGNRRAAIHINKTIPSQVELIIDETMRHYQLKRWLPLNHDNYQRFNNTDSLGERVELLESILCGNLLSMLKGLGITADKEIKVQINQLNEPYCLYNKGVGMMAFDGSFSCNLVLPRAIGIGKNASIGYGVVHPDRQSPTPAEQ